MGLVCRPAAGVHVLSNGRDNTLKLLDVRNFSVVRTLRAPTYRVGTDLARPCFSPDGVHVAAGGADGAMHLWAADSGELTAVLRGHGAAVSAAAWSPLGVPLASCDKNGVALLWES